MPNITKILSRFIPAFHRLMIKYIKINGLSVDNYIERESQRRSKVWRKKHDEFASAVQQLNDIIFKKDEEIILLKAMLTNTPTKKMIFDKFLQDQIDSGELTLGGDEK